MSDSDNNSTTTQKLIFTYGTLKQGFANYGLMGNDAVYLGTYLTHRPYPLVCGPFGVPFLINLPGSGHRVKGELYAVPFRSLPRIDELEGITLGHYERLPIQIFRDENVSGEGDGDGAVLVEAEAYFAHGGYGERLWEKKGREGLRDFTEKEARVYVKREDRPRDRSFLDQMILFLSTDTSN